MQTHHEEHPAIGRSSSFLLDTTLQLATSGPCAALLTLPLTITLGSLLRMRDHICSSDGCIAVSLSQNANKHETPMFTMRSLFILAVVGFSLIHACAETAPPDNDAGTPLFVVRVQGKDGFIDPSGQIVIEPKYAKAYPFSDGLAAVQIQTDGDWGFIDTKGKLVIEAQFAMVGFFAEGLAAFRKEYTSQWGYINKQGDVVIAARFDGADQFHKGIARVGFQPLSDRFFTLIADVGATLDYRFIDRTGTFVPDPGPTRFATGVPGELIPFTQNGKMGYVDADGNVIIEPTFVAAHRFSDGLACARKNDLYGYIDKSGEWVIQPRFQYPNDFSEGLAGVRLDGNKWGFIDRTGQEVMPAKFSWVYNSFRHGLAEVVVDGKLGYIDTKGEWVWKPSE